MKILITGANGFVGGHLLRKAITLYGNDNVFALTSKKISGCNCLIYKSHNLTDIQGSVLEEIHILIHAGAFTPKNAPQANHITSCNSNIIFTENLLTLPFSNLKKIINISTLDVYGSDDLISEQTPVNPQSLYGLSKLYCERIVDIYGKQNDIKVQTLRLGHIYGPGEEKYQKMLPLTLKNILENNPIEIWGDGEELRSFIYIDDVVQAIINSISLDLDLGPVNIVSGQTISIKNLVKKIVAMSATKIAITHKESSHIKRNFVFDNRLLKEKLLFEETDLDHGLKMEYNYMRECFEHHI